VGHFARIGEKRNSYRVLVGKPGRKNLLRIKWEDDIKTEFLERGNECGLVPLNPFQKKFRSRKNNCTSFLRENYAAKLNTETTDSSEAALNFYQTIRRQIPRQHPSCSPS
jgi:hypothetical protein